MVTESQPRWNFEPISKEHQRKNFDCGYPALNQYLKKYARQNHQKGIAKTFVATRPQLSLKCRWLLYN